VRWRLRRYWTPADDDGAPDGDHRLHRVRGRARWRVRRPPAGRCPAAERDRVARADAPGTDAVRRTGSAAAGDRGAICGPARGARGRDAGVQHPAGAGDRGRAWLWPARDRGHRRDARSDGRIAEGNAAPSFRDAQRPRRPTGRDVRQGCGQGADRRCEVTRDLSHYSDRDIAALALSGRQDAYREFLARYKAPVFRLIRSNVGDEGEAMDLTQESFVAGFAALGRYDGERPFRVWISRIAL